VCSPRPIGRSAAPASRAAPRRFPWSLAFIAVLATISYGCQDSATTQSQAQLELEQEFVISLPDSFELAGAAVSPSGLLALWAANSAHIVLATPRSVSGEVIDFGPDLSGPIGAAFVGSDSLLEIVDTAGPTILGFSLAGRLVYERRLQLGEVPEVAARLAGGWFLGARDQSGRYHVYRADHSIGQTLEIFSVELEAKEHRYLPVFQLSVGEGEVYLAMTEPPFETYRISPDGELLGTIQPRWESAPGALDAGPEPLIVALPLVPLGDQLLQTLADLSSDLRIILVYDRTGRVLRRKTLQAPVGFLTSCPDRHLLIAARWVGSLDLVGYRWRWRDFDMRGGRY